MNVGFQAVSKEACIDTGIATVINFPINIILLYIAANTFILWVDTQEQEIFWIPVYLTIVWDYSNNKKNNPHGITLIKRIKKKRQEMLDLYNT